MNFDHNHDGPGHHICMWEGPSYHPSAIETQHEVLKSTNRNQVEEIQRLRSLLDENNVVWAKETKAPSKKYGLRQSTLMRWTRSNSNSNPSRSIDSAKSLPHLPNEIVLRILGILVTSSHPIIDPFWKLRPEHLTKEEKAHTSISISFLGTCKAFYAEGLQLFFAKNTFVFTQAAALENLANLPVELRSTINHLTLRIVGKYYDDTSYRKVMTGVSIYHPEAAFPTMTVDARPAGTVKDKGIQAYCWQQVVDCVKAMTVSNPAHTKYTPLFPSLGTMRIDLVNFCEHLPFIGSPFISVLRWHLGKMLDRLIITGVADEDATNGEERFLAGILKDGGIFATSFPVFVSVKSGAALKSLSPIAMSLQLIRPPPVSLENQSHFEVVDPEGGIPPKSKYPEGETVWKYTSDNLASPRKKWIEFHRRCGYQVKECGELIPLNSDSEDDEDEEFTSDEEEDEDEDEDNFD